MMLQGYWYPNNSSNRYDAELHLESNNFKLLANSQIIEGSNHSLSFSQRVGNIPRKISLPDNTIFETKQNDLVDSWLEDAVHDDNQVSWMHHIERKWQWALLSLIILVGISFATIKWGLPWASEKIAYELPASANKVLAEGTLKALDNTVLTPSSLPEQRQQEIRTHVEKLLLPLQRDGFIFTVHFRDMNGIANAFALPSGDIVVTDELAKLLTKQEELDSVLLHEIGHVMHRHSLRQTIQSSAITVIALLITGDTSAIDDWSVALPTFLLQNSYSREFETDADVYAFDRMMELNIDPVNFANALHRITKEERDSEDEHKDKKTESKVNGVDKAIEYLSSHPLTSDREEMAKAYSAKFQAKQHP